jgi:hypothetical protein
MSVFVSKKPVFHLRLQSNKHLGTKRNNKIKKLYSVAGSDNDKKGQML